MAVIFKNLDEKQAALDAIDTDPPPGVNIDEFQTTTEAKIDEIMQAQVTGGSSTSPDAGNEPPPEGNLPPEPDMNLSAPTPPPASNEPPAESEPDMNIQENTPAAGPNLNKDQEMEILRRNNEYLKQLNETSNRDSDEKFEKLEKKIDELKKQNKAPEKKGPKVEGLELEIGTVRKEIDDLEKLMNDDDDLYDTETQLKNVKKASQLQIKLSALREKKWEDLMSQQASELKTLKNDQTLKRKSLDDEDKDNKRDKTIEGFRTLVPALRGDKKYSEMEEEYSEFAVHVAAAYFNIDPRHVKAKDTEIAMQKYLTGNPILNESLMSRGVTEPEDMRKFVVLSEIDALRQGYVLDKLSGKFVPLKAVDGGSVNFPSHKSAYLHLQQENGEYGKDILKAQKIAAKNMMHAMTRRANPTELTHNEQRGPLDDMTEERADSIIEKYSTDEVVLRARKNFKDPLVVEYNKALAKIGHAQLTKEDLES